MVAGMGGWLALDLATRTGWAYGAPHDLAGVGFGRSPKPRSGFWQAPKGASLGRHLQEYHLWLSGMLAVMDCEGVVFEAPLFRIDGKSNIDTARRLMGMASETERTCYALSVPVREANVMTIKKHFTGSGRADKRQMLDACRLRGWQVEDHNEADALALLDFALAQLAFNRRVG